MDKLVEIVNKYIVRGYDKIGLDNSKGKRVEILYDTKGDRAREKSNKEKLIEDDCEFIERLFKGNRR